MLDEIGVTYMMINGSEESGIDILRTKIKNFYLQFHLKVDVNILF